MQWYAARLIMHYQQRNLSIISWHINWLWWDSVLDKNFLVKLKKSDRWIVILLLSIIHWTTGRFSDHPGNHIQTLLSFMLSCNIGCYYGLPYYSSIKDIYGGCPIIVAMGHSETGKSTAIRAALALFGVHRTSRFVSTL